MIPSTLLLAIQEFSNLSDRALTAVIVGVAMFLIAVASFVGFMWFTYYGLKKKVEETSDDNLIADVAFFYEKGKREHQEDAYYISPLEQYKERGIVATISDGMGGLKYGDIISRYIVRRIEEVFQGDSLESETISDSIAKISDEIYEKYKRKGGATLATVHVYNNKMNFYSVGDSDIVLIRNGVATIINPKQNYSAILIKNLCRMGENTKEAYLNRKSRALVDYMGNSNVRVNYTCLPMKLYDGDVIVVCSDGVTDAVAWNRLPMVVSHEAKRTADGLKLSVKGKNLARQDNYTGIVIQLRRSNI